MRIRIGTRRSQLARTQAAEIAGRLSGPGRGPELVPIETSGDRSPLAAFGSIGAEGVFVREIAESLLSGRIDLAVHSFKDLPTRAPEELVVAAVPLRRDPADVVVLRRRAFRPSEPGLPVVRKARLGTASSRRRAWIRALRPDIAVAHLRGNVPTRIARVGEGLDGVVLAAAGLDRLRESSLSDVSPPVPPDLVVHRLPPDEFIPAPAQGALAIQCRRDDRATRAAVRRLDHPPTRQRVTAERSLLAQVEGGCQTAFGAWCSSGDSSNHRFRLVAGLERAGQVFRVSARARTAAAVVDTAWKELRGQWEA